MLNFILLQADAGGGFNTQWIMIGAMVIIFYLFFIRPQQKKQKDQKNFIHEVKKGDPIVTVGGIHGKIHSVDETTVMMELDKGFKMKIEKSSISQEATKRLTAVEK